MQQYIFEHSFHAAWESLGFGRGGLATTTKEPVQVLRPGQRNPDQGPDFLDALVAIGGSRHYGHVELHIRGDDWYRHGHNQDPNYNPVILHVVLEPGRRAARRADGTDIPELCLGDRIGPAPASKSPALPCAGLGAAHLPAEPWQWLEALGSQRMASRLHHLGERLRACQRDWQQLLWEELAAAMGGPVNGLVFRQLAALVPWSLMRHYCSAGDSTEAILCGMAGILDGRAKNQHDACLRERWTFISTKHRMKTLHQNLKSHRMRPAGQPRPRLRQLAMICRHYQPLISLLSPEAILGFLSQQQAGSGLQAAFRGGRDLRQRIAINVLAPLWELWYSEHKSGTLQAGMQALLRDMGPEDNRITRQYKVLGIAPANALQSQGLLALHKSLCLERHCLRCPIGSSIIRR